MGCAADSVIATIDCFQEIPLLTAESKQRIWDLNKIHLTHYMKIKQPLLIVSLVCIYLPKMLQHFLCSLRFFPISHILIFAILWETFRAVQVIGTYGASYTDRYRQNWHGGGVVNYHFVCDIYLIWIPTPLFIFSCQQGNLPASS